MTISLTDARNEVKDYLNAHYRVHGGDATVVHGIADGPARYPLSTSALRVLLSATAAPVTPLDEIEVGNARNSDPRTSHEAVSIASVTAKSARGKILLAFAKARLRGWAGVTAEGAINMAQLNHQRSPWKRVSELKQAGLIEPTGDTEIGASKAKAEKLRITDAGYQMLQTHLPSELAELVRAVG